MLKAFFRRAAFPARTRLSWLALPCACAWMTGASAAEAVPEPAASVPIKQYQGWRDEPLQDWRQVNERVGEVGGWRTYLRESQDAGDAADRGGQGDHGPHGH